MRGVVGGMYQGPRAAAGGVSSHREEGGGAELLHVKTEYHCRLRRRALFSWGSSLIAVPMPIIMASCMVRILY
jgi:hypothetical protein